MRNEHVFIAVGEQLGRRELGKVEMTQGTVIRRRVQLEPAPSAKYLALWVGGSLRQIR